MPTLWSSVTCSVMSEKSIVQSSVGVSVSGKESFGPELKRLPDASNSVTPGGKFLSLLLKMLSARNAHGSGTGAGRLCLNEGHQGAKGDSELLIQQIFSFWHTTVQSKLSVSLLVVATIFLLCLLLPCMPVDGPDRALHIR